MLGYVLSQGELIDHQHIDDNDLHSVSAIPRPVAPPFQPEDSDEDLFHPDYQGFEKVQKPTKGFHNTSTYPYM